MKSGGLCFWPIYASLCELLLNSVVSRSDACDSNTAEDEKSRYLLCVFVFVLAHIVTGQFMAAWMLVMKADVKDRRRITRRFLSELTAIALTIVH